MYLLDTSVWLPLAISKHVHHAVASAWLDSVERPNSILFCRSTQQAFLRLLTNASIQRPYGDPPLTNEQAWEVYDALLEDERVILQANEPDGLEPYWRQYSSRRTASRQLWMDAYLAAFARAANHQLVTIDIAFRQFEGLDLLLLAPDQ